jgi:hypothetical protein
MQDRARSAPDAPPDLGAAGAALWAYWWSLPRDGLVPPRAAFDPMRLARHLPIVSMTEHEAAGVWRVRLAGSGIVQRTGFSLTGVNYLDLLPAARRARQDARLGALLAQPCGALGGFRHRLQSGVGYQTRVLSLPLADAPGRVRLVVSTNEKVQLDESLPGDRMTEVVPLEGRFIDIGAGIPTFD